MTQFKYGLIDPREELAGIARLSDRVTAPLPAPAPTVSYEKLVAEWPMALNDQLGDCTIAGFEHVLEVHAAEVSATFAYPGDPSTKSTYFGLTGGPDSGLLLSTVISAASTVGLFGHKVIGAASVQPTDTTSLKQTIDFWGAAYVGVQCPQSAQQQFSSGQPFTVVPGSPIEGGHCIIFVGYDFDYLYAVTWGGVVQVAWSWWALYGSQAFALITDFFTAAGHGPTSQLDLPALTADLAVLNAS